MRGRLGWPALAALLLTAWTHCGPVAVTNVVSPARAIVAAPEFGDQPSFADRTGLRGCGLPPGVCRLAAGLPTRDAAMHLDAKGIVGARFDGHPWTQQCDLEIVEPGHPATAHLDGSWCWTDEVYQFRDLRPDARVLLRVPEDQLDGSAPGAKRPGFGFPVSWCFTEGAGRVFSTSLGHFPGAWESVTYLRHLSGGAAWALGSDN